MSRFPYIALRLASTRNIPFCTRCTRAGDSLRFAPVPLMPYNFPHSAPSHKAQPKLSMARFSGIEKAHGFLRRLVRCSQMVLRYFLSGIGTGISVPSLNWKVRSLSLPTIAISTVEFQRSGSNSIRMSPHCRSLSSQRRISFFLLCRAWIWIQPGDLRLQLLALVMQGVIPLSILR